MKCFVDGIPDVLSCCPQIDRQLISPKTIEEAMKHGNQIILPVSGDCMERAGIEHHGFVAVDFTCMPRVPKYGKDGYQDACLCLAAWPGQKEAVVMVKAYLGKWGPVHTVGTMYDNLKGGSYRMDAGLFAQVIYGVIFAAWGRDGLLKWVKDVEIFPSTLATVSTIHGENVGEPQLMEETNGR